MKHDQIEQVRETLQSAVQQFAEQFNCDVNPTGIDMEEENRLQHEYEVNGLIESNVKGLGFNVNGGWFYYDVEHDTIHCLLDFKMNGENLKECHGIQSWYDLEKEEWSDLEYEAM